MQAFDATAVTARVRTIYLGPGRLECTSATAAEEAHRESAVPPPCLIFGIICVSEVHSTRAAVGTSWLV